MNAYTLKSCLGYMFFLLLGILFLDICSYAEDIQITTYYPSPFGIYQDLQSSRAISVGDINNDGSVNTADLPGETGNLAAQGIIAGRVAVGDYNEDGSLGVEDLGSPGTLNVGSIHARSIFAREINASIKNFIIDHPLKENQELVHTCVEGPEAVVFYRGQARLKDGKALIELPEYFEALTREEGRTVQLTAKGEKPFFLSYSPVESGEFRVYGTEPEGEFSWEVKAVRADIEKVAVERPK